MRQPPNASQVKTLWLGAWPLNKKDPSVRKGPFGGDHAKKEALVVGGHKGVGMLQMKCVQSDRAEEAGVLARHRARRSANRLPNPK